ncbi:hypothetical protein [Staphylococcus massiliensis]|uniref:Lipoprotein n=1 Tax=Staphylococcus massiliensis S46 TaxID=1229783 RepID=K9ASI1_9STAP|nr:hypothetical protein [Staphylococcus massiliensis]EKU49016.1 lipoprotein [Staphylococcus massiliensis S46]PNZ99492.1 hypothetical protein CD133_06290 [Staphylococcus massiliensis CCUG 55927]
MKRLILLLSTLFIFTTACDGGTESKQSDKDENQKQSEPKSEEKSKDKATEESKSSKSSEDNKEAKTEETSKSDETKESEKASESDQATESKAADDKKKDQGVSNLSPAQKAALVFSADEASEFTLSKREILTGIFEQHYSNPPEKKQLYKLHLIKMNPIPGAPKDMKFYTVYPPKKPFATKIGIGKDKAFIAGSQSPGSYQELLKNGKELDLNQLYQDNKQLKSFNELAQKVEFSNQNPLDNEQTAEKYKAEESTATMTRARTQVYDMINKFEGKPIDTEKYIWDNVKWHNGITSWTVNYRDQNLEIVGTYKKEEGKPIVKLDAQGNKIK